MSNWKVSKEHITLFPHHNAIQIASLIGEHDPVVAEASQKRENQGFLTSHDRYVSRSIALLIAREQGQLLMPELPQEKLTSEDLY